jgi:DNA polymerase III subunit gamma/tau
MSNFVVSARKYRPALFADVVGQAHVAGTLKNALATDHLAHAFLFTGPRGVGKTTCARILAKILNCQNRTKDFEACNECGSCKAFNENASFNIIELDAASNNSVEHIRALIEQVRFQPQQGKYKVFIIDEVHMLSNQAFNAFLKTLEEPPPYAIFILATTEKHKIIPTILSRCQIFDFRRISIADMVTQLQDIAQKEGIIAEPDALHIIAQKADGAMRDALSIFDRITSFSNKKINYNDVIENLNVLDYDYYFQITDALMREDMSAVLNNFDEILRKGFEPEIFINGLAEHIRNVLVCKDASTLALLEVGENLKERYRNQAALAPNSLLLTVLNLCNDCDIHYKMARNKRLHVEMALIKMSYVNRAIKAVQTNDGMAEKKTPDGSPSLANTANTPQTPVNTAQNVAAQPTLPLPLEPTSQLVAEPNAPLKYEINTPEPTPEPPAPKGLGRLNGKKGGLSLESFEAEVHKEDAIEAARESKFNLESAKKEWQDYANSRESPTLRTAMKDAELNIELPDYLLVKVGLMVQKNLLLEEQSRLLDFLREQLHDKQIKLKINVDEEKMEAQKIMNAPKKVLSTREKYDVMQQSNPVLGEMMQRFELRLED